VTTRAVGWPALLASLVDVERLEPGESGVLSFGASAQGGVLVEDRRICWAAAPGLQPRLRELLQARAEGDGDSDFEHALRCHSVESLIALSLADGSRRWATHRGVGYAPRFTFRPLDLLLDVVALALPVRRADALDELAPFLAPSLAAASFYRDASGAVVPVAAFGEAASVEMVVDLGRTACGLTAAAAELGTPSTFSLMTMATGHVLVAWWHRELVHVALCASRAVAARLTGLHLTRAMSSPVARASVESSYAETA